MLVPTRNSVHQVSCARIVGRSHASSNSSCQDFVACRKKSKLVAAALADGAGSRVNSEFGAEAVVRASLRLLMRQFDYLFQKCSVSLDEVRKEIHDAIILDLKDVALRHSCSIDDLASTMLFVAFKEGRYLAAHLVAGVIEQTNSAGRVVELSLPENGEYSNTTFFVTDASAASRIRIYFGSSEDKLLGFALMSDGTAESLYEKRTKKPASIISRLLEWNRDLSRKKMNIILHENMVHVFSKKTVDDCSIALISIQQ